MFRNPIITTAGLIINIFDLLRLQILKILLLFIVHFESTNRKTGNDSFHIVSGSVLTIFFMKYFSGNELRYLIKYIICCKFL